MSMQVLEEQSAAECHNSVSSAPVNSAPVSSAPVDSAPVSSVSVNSATTNSQAQPSVTQRERELGAIISAYNEVTEQLKGAHDRLNKEVAGLRDELNRKNAELRRRERLAALGGMAAGLAHEIRNPLGGIALYASMLEGQLADQPQAASAASKISQGVRSLEHLVTEILDFAQEDRLECQVCELGSVLSDVEHSIVPWAEPCKATVIVEPAAFDLAVYCDARRLAQAILNLLMNGVQAAGQGGTVRVNASLSENDGSVAIEVSDDGPGISPDHRDKIFNPFFTTRDTGTGLGLAIVHRIVEAHGGAISVCESDEGGAKFALRLPPQPSEGSFLPERGQVENKEDD